MNEQFKKYFDKILVISLSGSRRRQWIDFHFKKLGIEFEYLDACPGDSQIVRDLKSGGHVGYCDFWDREFIDTEIACYRSHYYCWELAAFAEKGILILEDDAQLDKAEWLLECMSMMPENWNIVHFYSNYPVGSGRMNDKYRIHLYHGIWQANCEHSGAICYALSQKGAQKLVETAWPMKEPADGQLQVLSKTISGLENHAYIVKPLPVASAHCGLVSEIGKRDYSKKPEHIG